MISNDLVRVSVLRTRTYCNSKTPLCGSPREVVQFSCLSEASLMTVLPTRGLMTRLACQSRTPCHVTRTRGRRVIGGPFRRVTTPVGGPYYFSPACRTALWTFVLRLAHPSAIGETSNLRAFKTCQSPSSVDWPGGRHCFSTTEHIRPRWPQPRLDLPMSR
jgi:hypothetical protein